MIFNSYYRCIDEKHEEWPVPGGEPIEFLGIQTVGCGCCSTWYPLTPERLEEAIEETQAFLDELLSYRGRV